MVIVRLSLKTTKGHYIMNQLKMKMKKKLTTKRNRKMMFAGIALEKIIKQHLKTKGVMPVVKDTVPRYVGTSNLPMVINKPKPSSPTYSYGDDWNDYHLPTKSFTYTPDIHKDVDIQVLEWNLENV